MLEYRRSFEAEQKRADELEAQHRILEASIQAVEVCWTQVRPTQMHDRHD
jgi:E3 ubiquitin-protein ligase BRE1